MNIAQGTADSMSFMFASVSLVPQAHRGKMGTDLDGCKVHGRFVSVLSLGIPNLLKDKKPNFAPETFYLLYWSAHKSVFYFRRVQYLSIYSTNPVKG